MSAPNQGRQSPEPERQTDAQQNPLASKPNEHGVADNESQPADASKEQLGKLESNPKHVLKDNAESKTSK